MRVVLAILVAISLSVGGCDRDATEAECEKMVAHVFDVEIKSLDDAAAALSRPVFTEMQDVWVGECQKHGKRSEVRCVLKAKTKKDIDKCAPSGQ